MPEGQLEEGSLLNDRYRIIRVIGQGGMGTVYQAEHERLNAVVAVKEIRGTPVTGTAQQATMDQYEQEARFLVRLNHPNLPKVTDAFVDGNRFYLVMDFVDGVTLDNCLRARGGTPIDPKTVVEWAIEITDVLGYLHSQNPPIIFRDLKPSNVMVQSDGHIKLIDFGIARRFQPGATQDTALLGNVGYSPPEQFGKHQTDTRSDIYALGATMHHLLTARDPSTTPFKFAPVDSVSLGTPASLTRLIAQCVALEPDLRPPNVAAVAAALRAIRDELNHVSAQPDHARAETDAKILSRTPTDPVRTDKDVKIMARMSTVGTVGTSGMPGSRRVYAIKPGGGRRASQPYSRLKYVVLAFVIVGMFGATAVSVENGNRQLRAKKHPSRKVTSSYSSNSSRRSPGSDPISGSGVTDSSLGGNGAGDSGSQPSGDASQSAAADPSSPPADAKTAQCNAEVLGPSPDGKSLRLHVTGEINGKKDTSGIVAAYF